MNDNVNDTSIQDLENERDDLTIDMFSDSEENTSQSENDYATTSNHLSSVKHPQQDFFIADIFDAISFQTDIASLEYPLFVLKAGDTKNKHFEVNGFKIDIRTSLSHATIHDKDIWIYCISKIMQAKREGKETSRTVHFTIYDYLKTTNRETGGINYERTKDSLDRLRSTSITTEIETDKIRDARGFGLIDSWRIVEEKDGRMVRVSVTLPDWLYRSIEAKAVLTISPDYFRLRKPLDRRIYELARKHCGNNKEWNFNLGTLKEKSGSSSTLKEFRRAIKSLAISNQLPDYMVLYDEKKDQVTFKNRSQDIIKKLPNNLREERKSKKTFESRENLTVEEAFKKYIKTIEMCSNPTEAFGIISRKHDVHFTNADEFWKNVKSKVIGYDSVSAIVNNMPITEKSEKQHITMNKDCIRKMVSDIKIRCEKEEEFLETPPTEENKRAIAKNIINEFYDDFIAKYRLVNEQGIVINQMGFISIMYPKFNIPTE